MSALPDQVDRGRVHARRSRFARGVPIELRVEVDYERLRFAYRIGGGAWHWLPQQFDASILSDEATRAGDAELHRRVRRHGVSGSRRHGDAGRLRLVRVP